ncbi:MAG: SCO family protein [Deltaproteobacteria bacterium]|nr:SCO family protein [Deltaproteobacteria bacterium]
MPKKKSRSILLCCALLAALAVQAQAAETSIVHPEIPDVELVNQSGTKGRFVSDFIGDRLAVLTFTFTSCKTVCPVLDGIFKSVQGDLADRLGKEAVILTVTVDPERDVPARIQDHAERIGAKPGWSYLTGEKDTVNTLLRGVEVYSPDILDHSPTVFVVDGRSGVWTRLYGFPTPEEISKVLDDYRALRSAPAQS